MSSNKSLRSVSPLFMSPLAIRRLGSQHTVQCLCALWALRYEKKDTKIFHRGHYQHSTCFTAPGRAGGIHCFVCPSCWVYGYRSTRGRLILRIGETIIGEKSRPFLFCLVIGKLVTSAMAANERCVSGRPVLKSTLPSRSSSSSSLTTNIYAVI